MLASSITTHRCYGPLLLPPSLTRIVPKSLFGQALLRNDDEAKGVSARAVHTGILQSQDSPNCWPCIARALSQRLPTQS